MGQACYRWQSPIWVFNTRKRPGRITWITILRKREGYRKAFRHFDVKEVAQMTSEDVERLMQFDGIVKNRLKIKSAISNAKLFMAIQEEFGSFYKYTLSFFPNQQPVVIISRPWARSLPHLLSRMPWVKIWKSEASSSSVQLSVMLFCRRPVLWMII